MVDWNNMAMEWLSDYAPMGVFVAGRPIEALFAYPQTKFKLRVDVGRRTLWK